MAKGFRVKKRPPSSAQQFFFFREEVRKHIEVVADEHVDRRELIVGSWTHQPQFQGGARAEGTHILTEVTLENPGESLGRYGGNISDLWRWHNLGTKAHFIYPRFKRALRFVVDGVLVITRRVSHPGMKARRYTQKTNRSLVGFEKRQIAKGFRSAWKKLEQFNKRPG